MKKKAINYMTINTISRNANENAIVSAVSGFTKQMGDVTISELNDINTVVREAVTNVIKHAYGDEIGKISIKISIFKDNLIEIKVRDWGCGIDNVDKAMKPLFTTGGEDCAGLGFTVMKVSMDSVKVYSSVDKGTIVTVKKTCTTKQF